MRGMVSMNINELIPFNGKTIQTKLLHELGFSSKDINKLLKDNILTRTRRGYYSVSIDYEVDTKLMKYYLMNSYFDDFKEYFDSLTIKDYNAYYYRFLCDVLTGDYANCYEHLYKCVLLNSDERNKINILAYLLLINELVELPPEKVENLKQKLFNKDYYLDSFLECLLKKDYNNACDNLRIVKENKLLDKFDISILRDLSIKAQNSYNKKNSKDHLFYQQLFNELYFYVSNNDFDQVYYTYNKLSYLNDSLKLSDKRLDIIKDLLECFNYIVKHPKLTLENYKTNYTYGNKLQDNFTLAIKRNDYLKALEFCSKLCIDSPSQEFEIYKILLERIYNFLNVRTIVNSQNPYFKHNNSLSGLVRNKKYKEALNYTTNDENMDVHNKTIISSLLETLLSIDNIGFKTQEN